MKILMQIKFIFKKFEILVNPNNSNKFNVFKYKNLISLIKNNLILLQDVKNNENCINSTH